MCLVLVAIGAHPRLHWVIAANRDEFHARAASPAHWWPDGTLAGVDRVAGGTWFGVDAAGRWALVTNFREGVPRDPDAPSRGELVTRALRDRSPPLVCAAAIAADGDRYHGFNLLVGDGVIPHPRRSPGRRGESRESLPNYQGGAAYASNRASGAIALGAGVHGLSNHLLETAWPKVVRSKARLSAWLASGSDAIDPLFDLLGDRSQAEPSALPATGVAPEWERLLSSAFIVDSQYGTRCSTVLTISTEGRAQFLERSFDAQGRPTGEVAFEFQLGSPKLTTRMPSTRA